MELYRQDRRESLTIWPCLPRLLYHKNSIGGILSDVIGIFLLGKGNRPEGRLQARGREKSDDSGPVYHTTDKFTTGRFPFVPDCNSPADMLQYIRLCSSEQLIFHTEEKGRDAMDAFVEQIVKKKKGGKEIGIIVGSLILLAVLLFLVYFFLIPYIRQFFIILAAAAIYGEWWLITEQNVEYEYSVTNGDIDVDQITARRKRKRIVSVPGAKIESLEPYRAEAYAGRQFDRRVMAATSETAEGVWCFTYRSKKNGHTLVLFQPEQRVLETLRTGLSATLQRELDKKLQQG